MPDDTGKCVLVLGWVGEGRREEREEGGERKDEVRKVGREMRDDGGGGRGGRRLTLCTSGSAEVGSEKYGVRGVMTLSSPLDATDARGEGKEVIFELMIRRGR